MTGDAVDALGAPSAVHEAAVVRSPEPEAPAAAGPRHARKRSRAAGAAGSPGSSGSATVEMAVTGRYLPSLDGLRALAVAGVVAYHFQLGWASGGYLGVDLFFVLSGFLITSLLLEEWVSTATIRLAAFWARRARRLLPALFLVLVALAIYVVLNGTFGSPGSSALIDLQGLRGDALATLLYFANWHYIFAHQSYFAQFSAPSPLDHTWSLAIEEQFYLVWPLVLLAFLPRVRRRWRTAGTVVTVVGALASATLMAVLYHPGTDPTRVYFGTDTRMFDMLAGATVAMVVAARPQPGRAARRVLHALSPLAAVALAVFWVTSGTPGGLPASYMFRGGFLVCAVLAAVVIADVRQLHMGPLGRALAVQPLRAIGKISYGIYLWHWPIVVYLTQERTGLAQPWLDLVRVALTLAVSTASYVFVERPIRRRQWAGRVRFVLAPAAAVVTATCVVVATIPAVAAPTTQAPSTAAVKVTSTTSSIAGAGGFTAQQPIRLLPGRVVDPAHPLRVMLIGDSVMKVAEPAIAASLEATGEVTVFDNSIDGFGLNNATNWRTSIPNIIATEHPDLIIGTWSWDDSCTAEQEAQGELCAQQNFDAYRAELEGAVRLMLHPGDGVAGVIFVQFPKTGPVYATTPAEQRASDAARAAGQAAWDRVIRSLPALMPGKVMYLPIASSVLLDNQFSTWLPPATRPDAPSADWVRVRMVDDVHLCPAGAVRYADALLADLTTLYRLAPARGTWWNGSWTSDPRYNDPPGSCPDDHPGS